MTAVVLKRRAIIVSLNVDTGELERLATSMDYDLLEVHVQKRAAPHPAFFVGKGKVEELSGIIARDGVDVVLFNHDLKPSQIFSLEREWRCRVLDRTRLILEIFTDRAKNRREARLQVQLTTLQYELPYVRELIHRMKQGEHPGYMAGGEYKVDQYYEMISKRMRAIKENLEAIRKEKDARRRRRRESGFFLVSIAGYTNAGKSSLLARLTDSEPVIEDRYFSTLFTLTKKGRKGVVGNENLLFTDTVGFISGLPPWVVEAFRSTMEEIFLSDLVLLVVDVSDDKEMMLNKIRTGYTYSLGEVGVGTPVFVFNKLDDALKGANIDEIVEKVNEVGEVLEREGININASILVSCKDGRGIDDLIEMMIELISKLGHVHMIRIRFHESDPLIKDACGGYVDLINWLFKNAIVLKRERDGIGKRIYTILCKEREYHKIKAMEDTDFLEIEDS